MSFAVSLLFNLSKGSSSNFNFHLNFEGLSGSLFLKIILLFFLKDKVFFTTCCLGFSNLLISSNLFCFNFEFIKGCFSSFNVLPNSFLLLIKSKTLSFLRISSSSFFLFSTMAASEKLLTYLDNKFFLHYRFSFFPFLYHNSKQIL